MHQLRPGHLSLIDQLSLLQQQLPDLYWQRCLPHLQRRILSIRHRLLLLHLHLRLHRLPHQRHLHCLPGRQVPHRHQHLHRLPLGLRNLFRRLYLPHLQRRLLPQHSFLPQVRHQLLGVHLNQQLPQLQPRLLPQWGCMCHLLGRLPRLPHLQLYGLFQLPTGLLPHPLQSLRRLPGHHQLPLLPLRHILPGLHTGLLPGSR
jgi:hypothetical protein